VGEARAGTTLPGRHSGAYDDPDRRPDLGDDRRARHLAADALSGMGDPQSPVEVADCTGEPSAAVDNSRAGTDRVLEGPEGGSPCHSIKAFCASNEPLRLTFDCSPDGSRCFGHSI